ncbi:MAG: hypothetical protein IT197_08495 [Acidimicrobiia bacterium]|nr:hypothetical protein [Acidimicrobiia bacterium]
MTGDSPALRPGQPWGAPFSGDVDVAVGGGDADLAAAIAHRPGVRVAFGPSPASQLARAVGLPGSPADTRPGRTVDGWLLPLDVIEIEPPAAGGPALAVNAVVAGPPPGRLTWWARSRTVVVHADGRPVHSGPATTVVVANGQYLDGADAVPRGHPGDGRVEVHVYALRRGERRAMRARLPRGAHIPHPRIVTATARRVELALDGPWVAVVDGVPTTIAGTVRLSVRPGAYRLAVPAPG